MKNYKKINGSLVSPSSGGVTADGRVISNFAGRISHDPAFAEANGYYPIAESEGENVDLLEEEEGDVTLDYVLQGGAWVLKRIN